MIKIFDNVVAPPTQIQIHKELSALNYDQGETDFVGGEVVGLTSELLHNTFTFNTLNNILINVKELTNYPLIRTYVNKFEPEDKPFFHTDSDLDGRTVLYYSNNKPYSLEQLGGTQFYIKDTEEIKEVLSIPGRIIVFSGDVLHRATALRTGARYTTAFKYEK